MFAKSHGIKQHPEWYPDLSEKSSIKAFQKSVGGKSCTCNMFTSQEVHMDMAVGVDDTECRTAVEGEQCYDGVMWAMTYGINIHPEYYDGLTPHSSFEDFQEALWRLDHEECPKPCPAASTTPAPCRTVTEGKCYNGVTWAMTHGIHLYPQWYPELDADSSFEQFQAHLYYGNHEECPMPCGLDEMTEEPAITTKPTATTTTTKPATTTRRRTITITTTVAPGTTSKHTGAKPLSSVRHCFLDPLEEGAGCTRLHTADGSDMDLNEYGQDTSGKTACLELMRSKGGNTFMYSVGQCGVWQCTSAQALRASATGFLEAKAEVYSELCNFQEPKGGHLGEESRAPIMVKLWEWNYVDIARECEEYLGPNGFDSVQLSPVAEHITGPYWWTKYQPVSYGLNSRSGSAAEFQDMVARCRAAGVQLSVDLILNHIGHCGHGTCTGWNGTKFGNRWTNGSRGWDAATQEMFHHKEGHPDRGICGVGPSTGWLCGSPDMRDCSCCRCDMYGMPDWNTELDSVRELQAKHVGELHSMGITMLRIDASLYHEVDDLAAIINRFPWDHIYQEWWGEYPIPERTQYVGQYRDPAYRSHISEPLIHLNISDLSKVFTVTSGVFGIDPDVAIYPLLYHDGRSDKADPERPTYKNGLEYHQLQKFFLAWPHGISIYLWGGYSWTDLEQGPPGCEQGDDHCQPQPVFGKDGKPQCMPTPSESPLPAAVESGSRQWVCEHRWEGMAGMVAFRKACRGLPVTKTWGTPGMEGVDEDADGIGRIAFRAGEECFAALVRGGSPGGDWQLDELDGAGLVTGLPAGRYCDVSSLSDASSNWDRASCPREVVLGEGGVVKSGTVRDGDLLAIHTGARLSSAHTA